MTPSFPLASRAARAALSWKNHLTPYRHWLAVLAVALAACGEEQKKKPPELKEVATYPVRVLLVADKDAPQALRKERTKEEALRRAKDFATRLKADPSTFEATAKAESDDPKTAPDGGFFGFISEWTGEPEAMVKAAEALADGGVSEPVQVPAGYVVEQRLSREAGKRVENETTAVVEGFIQPWAPASATVPRTYTKDMAYADAARAVVQMRLGKKTLEEAREDLPTSQPVREGMRHAVEAGYEALPRVAFALAPEEVSDPIDTKGGWAVLVRRPYFRAYVRHIVVTHEGSLVRDPPPRTAAAAQKIAEEALTVVRADRSKWREAVLKYSNEPSSRAIAGYTGDVTNGGQSERRFPEEFEGAVMALAPGEMSGVVQTRFGFHIIWRVD